MSRISLIKQTFALVAFIAAWSVQADSAEGRWVSISDVNGEKESVIEIKKAEDGKLQGQIVHLFREDAKGEKCQDCPEPFKDQPILGLKLMWGLENSGDDGEWSGGEIIDPEDGSIYSVKLETSDDGQELELRGYVGISLFGRSQTWVREKPEQEEPKQENPTKEETTKITEIVSEVEPVTDEKTAE